MKPTAPPLSPGDVFGRLTVVRFSHNVNGSAHYLCRCECGGEATVRWRALKTGNTSSCGCLYRETRTYKTRHGDSLTRLHQCWRSMKKRCQHNPRYSDVSVCLEWDLSYESFRDWALSSGYSDDLTLERIDPRGNYEPSNCTWASLAAQAKNKRASVHITAFGETKNLNDWLRDPRCQVTDGSYYRRVEKGMSPEEALFTAPTGYPRPRSAKR